MSEQILLLNPRRKRRTNRRRRARSRRGRVPAGLARYMASRRANPRRRRRTRTRARTRRANPRRRAAARVGRHVRARSHNPRRIGRRVRARARTYGRRARRAAVRGFAIGRGMVGGYVIPAVVGGAGALALDIAWGYASPHLPQSVQSGYTQLAAKLAVILGAAYVMNRFAPKFRTETHRAAVGAATVLAYGAIKGAAQSVLPVTTPGLHGYIDFQSYALPGAGRLSGYMPRTLGSLEDLYSPAAVIQPPGTPVPTQFGGLRGYIAVQPHVGGGNGGLMGYDWSNDGM